MQQQPPAEAGTLVVRWARQEDEPRLYALVRALADEAVGEPPSRQEFASTFQRAFTPDAPFRYALVERGDRCVGCASLHVGFSTWRGRPTLEVHDEYLLPDERVADAPARLLAFAEAHARAVGATRIEGRARRGDAERVGLYAGHGFRDAGYVILRKRLDP